MQLQQKYSLKACPNFGKYAWRIIIPCFLNKIVVNFTALDVTGEAEHKYKHCPNEEATIPMKELLYNIDNAGKRLIIVEGITDVWRIGNGAIATMGIQFTTTQIKRIVQHKPTNVTIMFDIDPSNDQSQKQAKKLAESLSLFISKVSIYTLSQGDPDDLTAEEAAKIRKELL